MNRHEYKQALDNMSEPDFNRFRQAIGGGFTLREQYVRHFVDHPKTERRICQVLRLQTEAEKKVDIAARAAEAAERAAKNAEGSEKSAKRAWICSAIAVGVTVLSLFLGITRGCSANPRGDETAWRMPRAPSSRREPALATVHAYFAAESWRDRVPLVMDAERVRPLMQAYYAGVEMPRPFEILTQAEPIPSESGWVTVEVDRRGHTLKYYLKKVGEEYRIDWEASVGSNPMSAKEFHVTMPKAPVRFRVRAKLSDYYPYEFEAAKDYAYCIHFQDGVGDNDLGYGCVAKDTEAGQALFAMLRDGAKHRIVVELQHLPGAKSNDMLAITNVVNLDGWWYE